MNKWRSLLALSCFAILPSVSGAGCRRPAVAADPTASKPPPVEVKADTVAEQPATLALVPLLRPGQPDVLVKILGPRLKDAGKSPSAGNLAAAALTKALTEPGLAGVKLRGSPVCYGGARAYERREAYLKARFLKTKNQIQRREILDSWPVEGCTQEVAYEHQADVGALDAATARTTASAFNKWAGPNGRGAPRLEKVPRPKTIVATWFILQPARNPAYDGIDRELIIKAHGKAHP